MRHFFTYTLWAASLAVLLHISFSIRHATDSTAKEVAAARKDLKETTEKVPEIAEDAARRSASGGLDEAVVKPVRETARNAKREANEGLRRIGFPGRF